MAERNAALEQKEVKLKELTHISREVREKVYERDQFDGWTCCIYCGKPRGIEVHHFIERSRGGLGIEENLVCLCKACHTKIHQGDTDIQNFIRGYLSEHYAGWDENALIAGKD